MKRTSFIWYILGAVVLIALGFAVGYFLNGGMGRGLAMHSAAPFAQAGRGFLMPRLLFGALFGLGALIRWVGPLAGILALIIVLTRSPVVVAAPAQAATVAPAETSATAETAVETPTKPARKK